MTADLIIAPLPPEDGRQWDCQCARCGSSIKTESCGECGGDGTTPPGQLHDEDPMWHDEDDVEPCDLCLGRGHFRSCLSPEDYCQAHPRPGREIVPPGTVEWFTHDAPNTKGASHG